MKISKNLFLITLSAFFFFYAYHSYLILPLKIISMGGGEHDVGLIMSVAGASTIFFTPISGMLGDSYQKKKLLLVGALGLCITNFIFIYSDSLYFSYVLLRFFQGCSFSFFFVSAGTFVSQNIDIKNQAQALGFFGVFAIANHALAPTISTFIIDNFGDKYFFLVSSLASAICFTIILFLEDNMKPLRQGKKESFLGFLDTLKNKSLLVIFTIMFLVGGAFVTCLNFTAIFVDSFLISPVTIFFISYTCTALIMRICFGWIPDTYGRVNTCTPCLLSFGLSIGLLAFSSTTVLFILAGGLFGLSHALVCPSLYSLALSLTDDINKTKAFSVCSLSFTFGGMLFSTVYGYIAEIYSFKVMFLSCSIIVTTCFYFLTLKLKTIFSES